MKFSTVGLLFIVVTIASASPLSEFLDKLRNLRNNDSFASRFAEFKEKLRNHRIKIREFLNETRGHWRELDRNGDDLFNAAVDELHVNVDNNTDKTIKRRKFSKNLELAENLTKKHKNAFFGITPFSFMDINEFKKNYLMEPKDIKDIPINNATTFGNRRRRRATTSHDLRAKKAVSPIKQQGNCGSCWAFAAASTMETSNFKKTGKLYDLSEQQFVNCDPYDNGCYGGWMSTAYTYAKSGIALESTNPYRARESYCTRPSGILIRASSYTQLRPKDTTSMKNAIDQGYSLAVAIKAGTYEIMSYTGGILDDATDCRDNSVDHAVVIVGYGTENGISYWIVRNSWGTYWGEDGYFRIKMGINYCNVEYYPFFVVTS